MPIQQSGITKRIPSLSFFFLGGLDTIQRSGIFNDSKTYVDHPLRFDPRTVLTDFDNLPDHSQNTLSDFLSRNFALPGSDLINWTPADHHENPSILDHIQDPAYQAWARDLNDLWLQLGKQVTAEVYKFPDRHTLIGPKQPYMIVPGGRFTEFYYWDTYWVVRGLLLCDMVDTARLVVNNLLDFVERYGFMPNGSRRYYLNRSQPPFLTLMVDAVFQVTNDQDWLRTF